MISNYFNLQRLFFIGVRLVAVHIQD